MGSLVCTMSAINHYSINHTPGQGRLQILPSKLLHQKRAADMICTAAHPVSKRNMLFMLDKNIPNLKATWVPGAPEEI